MNKLLFGSCVFAILSIAFGATCVNPEITSKTFTTQDATIVLNIAYISEFDVKCKSGEITQLYAEINDNIVPVSIIGPNKYQISWTEETKKASSGDRVIRLFDEDGFTAFKKAVRSGEDLSGVPSLFNVVINHPGAYNGPWMQGEFIALVGSVVAAYFAIVYKSQISA